MSHIEQIPLELTWPIRQQVMYPGESLEKVKLKDDPEGIHFGLFDNNQLISICSWFKKDKKAQFRKFATLTQFQGSGYGTQLLKYIIQFSIRESVDILWCNARISAIEFYKKLGFTETQTRFKKNGHEFVIMQLVLEPGSQSENHAAFINKK